MSPLLQHLRRVVVRGRILDSPAQRAGYDADGLGYRRYPPDAVVIPADQDELSMLVGALRSLDVPFTMRGAGTSLSGGPVAAQGGVVIHTSCLRGIRHICARGFWCEVESGVVLNQLDAALEPSGLFYPPDPSSGPVCTLGGNIAMNAGGAHCFRYGVTSNYVLGVEGVMLDGSILRFGGPGGGRGPWLEDWKRLMVGSEGTLAAFTRFWLRLLPRPEKCWTWRAAFGDLKSAERAVQALALDSSFPVAIELMDPRCVAMVENSPMAMGLPHNCFLIVAEIDGPKVLADTRAPAVTQLLRDAGAGQIDFSDDEQVRRGLWKARKVAGGLMGQLSPDFLVQDAVIPRRALAEILQLVYDEADAAGLRAVNVFHAGDGNLHPNFLFDSRKPEQVHAVESISRRLMQRVVEVGGTLSGEHGIGNDKTCCMPLIFGPEAMRLQLAVPRIFNPRHQLNPLKVFETRRFTATGTSPSGGAHVSHAAPPTTLPPLTTERLFTPFFDEIDGTCCCPASWTLRQLDAWCRPRGFRFPLGLDPDATLLEHTRTTAWAPASSRFGPFCDNILGMNWELPDGRQVRLGERVVKSTTGYDLFRFLLHSHSTPGQPTDFVLRLRPDCGTHAVYRLAGPIDAVAVASRELLNSCWLHWFDAIDLLLPAIPHTGLARLRVTWHGPPGEQPVALDRLQKLARKFCLRLSQDERDTNAESHNAGTLAPADGLPDFVIKTSPDEILDIVLRLQTERLFEITTLLYPGVIHGRLTVSLPKAIESLRLTRLRDDIENLIAGTGGDVQSRHVSRRLQIDEETAWLKIFTQELSRT
ncbi:MAG: FAD-binding oxidoreductase [Planctomycetota bacterium]